MGMGVRKRRLGIESRMSMGESCEVAERSM
jgi:hypothetical protein